MRRPKQKEWDDIIIVDERSNNPLAFMSSDEIMAGIDQDAEILLEHVRRLERRVRFWRDWAIVASVLAVFLAGWLLAFISWAW